MSGPVLSHLWYRVAGLKPQLRVHAIAHRHRYRGEVWYLLQDPVSGRIHRFRPAAYLLIGLMDGKRTVAKLWEIANLRLGDNAPTQDELIQLLGQLHASDLLKSDVSPDSAELFDRGEREWRSRLVQSYANPMALRLRLWDPDRFLDRIEPFCRLVWSGWGAALWLAVVLPALALVQVHWPDLSNNFSDRILAFDNLFILYCVFPALKSLHEMGHATSLKANGGEVHDMGVILLVLLPVPYVEASSASVISSKYRRALVGAAGMMVELFVAAVAFYLWLAVEPGLVRAALFNVMVIAGVSTLVFNGNPLLRYDAYYILGDLIEMPNLGARSTRYWSYLLERYVFGARELEPPYGTTAEKIWFLAYGAASIVYRTIVTVLIALFIATRFFFIGVILALWAVGAMALAPLVRGVLHLTGSPRLHRHRNRAISITAVSAAALAAFVCLVPLPSHTNAEGVVWLPEQALVRAQSDGLLAEYLAAPGSQIKAGDEIARLYEPESQALLDMARARVVEAEALVSATTVADRSRSTLMQERLAHERETLAILLQKAGDANVKAAADGEFMVERPNDQLQRYFHKGELIGHVVGETPPMVRAVVPQDAIDRVSVAIDRVEVRFVNEPESVWEGKILRAAPNGDEMLPSRAFSVEGGGEIATDPRELKGAKAFRRMFQFDIGLVDPRTTHIFGQHALVRFEQRPETLWARAYRATRQLFLSLFDA